MSDEAIQTPETGDPEPDDPDPAGHTGESIEEFLIRPVFPHLDPEVVARVLGLRAAEPWEVPTATETEDPAALEEDQNAE